MRIIHSKSLSKKSQVDAVIVPFWIQANHVEIAANNRDYLRECEAILQAGDFLAKSEEINVVYSLLKKQVRIVLLGLGKRDDLSLEAIRKCYAALIKFARRKQWNSLCYICPNIPEDLLSAMIEGSLLANYTFDRYYSERMKKEALGLVEELICLGGGQNLKAMSQKLIKLVSAVNFTKDLVNGNADEFHAERLAQLALKMQSKRTSIKTLFEKELKKEKMGLMLAVNQGASKEPALVVIEYKGNPKSQETTAIIGKGITFDTGGLDIKINGGMESMKNDMAGAAAVLGVLQAVSELSLNQNVIGVIACAENAVGPLSYKPGDVVWSHSGKTVEINNTDAEGRLVLADAISYVQKHYKPTRMIDLATLTGGVIVALGEEASGLFSNNDLIAAQLISAGEKTFERLWRMPIFSEYRESLKSHIADLKNSGGRKASASKGAVFLQEFVQKDIPWAHLDIAGTAYTSEMKGYNTSHATGVGVRLMIEFLESL